MNGLLEILSVGDGDTKLTFNKDNPAERARAAKIVTDMLVKGYAILIQVGEKNGEPLYQRAKAFDPETCEYIIASAGDEVIDIGTEQPVVEGDTEASAPKRPRDRPRKTTEVRVPAEKTRAVSIGRTSGG